MAEPWESVAPDHGGAGKSLRGLMDEYERRLIVLALHAAGGHQRRAAASLGIQPSTLCEKIRRHGLRRRPRRPSEAVAPAAAEPDCACA